MKIMFLLFFAIAIIEQIGATELNVGATHCGSNAWSYHFANNLCYIVIGALATDYNIAQKSCTESMGADLAIIKTKEDGDFILDVTKERQHTYANMKKVWLGAKKTGDIWKWIDGTDVVDVEGYGWINNQPDLNEGDDCITFVINSQKPGWTTEKCADNFELLCVKKGVLGTTSTTSSISTTKTTGSTTTGPPTTTGSTTTGPPTTTGSTTTGPPTTTGSTTTGPPTTTGSTTTGPPPTTMGSTTTGPPTTTMGSTTTGPPPTTTGSTTTGPPPTTMGSTTTGPPTTTMGSTTTGPPATTGSTTTGPPTTTGLTTMESSTTTPTTAWTSMAPTTISGLFLQLVLVA